MWADSDSIKRSWEVSVPNLLEQWYELVEYSKKTFSLTGISYLVTYTWCKIFTRQRDKGYGDALLMIRLLFTVPMSDIKTRKNISKLKHVKTNSCCSLGVKCLENILRIMEEGSSWETFDPISAIKKWSNDKVRHTTKEKRSRSYKSCNFAKMNVKSLSDDDNYSEEENIFENGEEEGYLVSSDSK